MDEVFHKIWPPLMLNFKKIIKRRKERKISRGKTNNKKI